MNRLSEHALVHLVREENESLDDALRAFVDSLDGASRDADSLRRHVFRVAALVDLPSRLPGRKLLCDALARRMCWPRRMLLRLGEPRREEERARELEHALLASEVLGGDAMIALQVDGRLLAALHQARIEYVDKQMIPLAQQCFTANDWLWLDARAVSLALAESKEVSTASPAPHAMRSSALGGRHGTALAAGRLAAA